MKQGGFTMPTLKQFFEELVDLNIDPKKVRLLGQQYDELIEQAEQQIDDEDDDD